MLFMILQFLGEEKFKDSVHKLEQESGLFFDIKYFEDQVEAGEWEEVERYLSGFLKVNHNDESRTIFFEIRKQKYLETLDSQDRPKTIEILAKELRVCAPEENHFCELTHLLSLDNFRQNEKLSNYGDVVSQRKALINILRRHIELNPLLLHKLKLPAFEASSLRKMIERKILQETVFQLRDLNKGSPWMITILVLFGHLLLLHSLTTQGILMVILQWRIRLLIHNITCLRSAQPDEASCSSAMHSTNVYSADDLPIIKKLGQGSIVVTSIHENKMFFWVNHLISI